MKKISIILPACLLLVACGTHKPKKIEDYAALVNPMVGTDTYGHTFPGATMPFGMVQLSPDTHLEGWEGCSGYHYTDSMIYGFSHTHLSGTGCSDYGDILLMPTVGEMNPHRKSYASPFRHETEKAFPGFYAVTLDKPNVNAAFTVTNRVGFHQYTFPENATANIVLDLQHRDEVLASELIFLNDSTVCGMRTSLAWAKEQILYFVARFSQPIKQQVLYVNDSATTQHDAKGKNLKAVLRFDVSANPTVMVKVALSAVSVDGALRNLEAEAPAWDFEAVRLAARKAWNKELGKIAVEGGSEEQQKVFYTALYHTMIQPNMYMDVDHQYRGRDLAVHQADSFNYYTVFSLWDTYRAFHPLLSIIDQKRTNNFINTFLCQYQQGGLMPVWELSSCETNCMIGYHSVSVIADAFAKGIRNYDATLALEAMKASANNTKAGLDFYHQFAFIAGDYEHESVSKTLEYAYDDWCIAQTANALGKQADYREFIQRAQYYKNLYNPQSGFIQPKINGQFLTPFDPTNVSLNYTEANGWQYAFYVPQDVKGLADLMGGTEVFDRMLDSMFFGRHSLSGRTQADITGLIGQYAHGNEPSHHVAYLYDYIGKPWKTQQLTRRIMDEMYTSKPDGLCGNEDCGQMSAWYVMSAMGIYQVCPGNPQYAIGSPVFDKVTISLENGKTFVIEAKKQSKKNVYIQQAVLNGQSYNKCYLSHKDIMNGGVLTFTMGNKPNENWGKEQPSSSITDHLIVIAPNFSYEGTQTFFDTKTITINKVGKDIKVYYTLDGSIPTNQSTPYDQPFSIDKDQTVKAIAYRSDGKTSAVVEGHFYRIPKGRSIKILTEYSKQYTAGGDIGLLDHIRGKQNWRIGGWQGYGNGNNVDAIVDLGKETEVTYMGADFLQDMLSWIWMPKQVEFFVSDDGIHFTSLKTIQNRVPEKETDVVIKEYGFHTKVKTRYVRVKAENIGIIPAWHLSAGEKGFIFIDEIIIK